MASLTEKSSLCFISALLFLSLFCFFKTHGDEVRGEQREFDYFLLALQWPGTYCQKTKHCCASNGCCRNSNATMFTIHGLWADYNDGTWPSCCNGPSFDEEKISSLLDVLEKYWPSLSCSSPSTCSGEKGLFWAHEWEKHGTCSYPVVRDEYSYFLTALSVYFKYNVTKILSEAGYVPSNSEKYPLGGVVSAIENAVGASPQLVCSHDAIQELHICFYKDFKPRDCITASRTLSDMLTSKSSCPKYISLPKFMPPAVEDVKSAFPWVLGGEVL